MRTALITVIRVYRLIPAPVRSAWSADSSSHKALAALASGAPLGATMRHYAIPHFTRMWEPPNWDN